MLYRRALGAVKPPDRAVVLHRLARTLKKAGRMEEALLTFGLVEKEPAVLIGSLPSDLLALWEAASQRQEAALRLYRDLVGGRWQLAKASYVFYSERLREMLPAGEETTRLQETERRKLALSRAVESLLEEPRQISAGSEGYWLAFWRSGPFGAVVLGEPFLRTRLWPSAFQGPETSSLRLALIAPTGQLLFGEVPGNRRFVVTYTVQGTGALFRLQAWPADPAALHGSIGLRQDVYLGLLGGVLALLAFGAYLTVRTVRAELAVARMKSDFAATVSHEFRSPLAGINQLSEMLRDGRVKDAQKVQQYYEMIVGETQRLRRLVENVLDFSRMEDGRKQFRFDRLETARWLREVTDVFQAEAAREGFRIEASIQEDLPAVAGDREALTTALHNLLDNAVKYSCESRTVWLEAGANGDCLSISVRDRGTGIRDEDKPRIFEKFYRGGGEMARQVKGVGLGLNLVKRIVTAHGGTVDFESKQGEGSKFTIRLRTWN